MSQEPNEAARRAVDEVYQNDSRRVFATLVKLLGDFDLAEEAMHEAFASALVQWSRDGVPENPRAWLVSTGRFKAIDAIRRRARLDASMESVASRLEATATFNAAQQAQDIEDDRLRLIFTCCHPALAHGTQVALDAARGVRAYDRGDCQRLFDGATDDRATHRARQG